MIRIMVVEDDIMYRNKIISMLDWNSIGYEICGIAANGKEALEKLIAVNPDLIITDISMPQMNGIELIKSVRKINEHIRFIVLSAYDEFYLVKDAMRMGVDDYFLKQDIDDRMDQLLRILKDVQAIIQKSDTPRPLLEDNRLLIDIYLSNLVVQENINAQLIEERLRRFMVFFSFDKFMLAILRRKDCCNDTSANVGFRKTVISLEEESPSQILVFFFDESTGVCLFNLKGVFSASRMQSIVSAAIAKVEMEADQIFTAGISSLQEGILNLHTAFAQANEALQDTGFLGKPLFEFYHSVPVGSMPKQIQEKLSEICQSIKYQNVQMLENCVLELCNDILKRQITCRSMKHILQVLNEMLESENFINNDNMLAEHSCLPIENILLERDSLKLKASICKYCIQLIESQSLYIPTSNRFVKQALFYLQVHYQEEIILSDLSREVGLNENYLSNLFKKETGYRILEYLNELRIYHAKRFLRESNLKVNDVAIKCGISNASYFSKLFKEYTGISVSKYRSKFADSNCL